MNLITSPQQQRTGKWSADKMCKAASCSQQSQPTLACHIRQKTFVCKHFVDKLRGSRNFNETFKKFSFLQIEGVYRLKEKISASSNHTGPKNTTAAVSPSKIPLDTFTCSVLIKLPVCLSNMSVVRHDFLYWLLYALHKLFIPLVLPLIAVPPISTEPSANKATLQYKYTPACNYWPDYSTDKL